MNSSIVFRNAVRRSSPFWSAAVLSAGLLSASPVMGADAPAATAPTTWPVTSWGVPDLQGIFDYSSRTGVERQPQFEGRLTISQEEAERLVPSLQQYTDALEERGAEAPGPHNVGGYNAFWINPGDWLAVIDGELRTSFIIEPEDGRIPWNEGGREVRAAQRAAMSYADLDENDGPEGRSLAERCLISFASIVPSLPSLYNNTIQIVQSPTHVMILAEMAHDARIVKIGGKHNAAGIRQWHGDSIGWYEGNTLVVETINFHPEQVARAGGYTSTNAKITERFYRVNEREIRYQFTVEDPDLYSAPWTGEMPMFAAPNLYEYACHEGNHSMPGILMGARVLEQLETAEQD
jgi:hypothetical protein